MSDAFIRHRYNNLQSICNSDHISPVAGLSAKYLKSVANNRMNFIVTNLVGEEGIPDIFCHSGHGQNVILTFPIVWGTNPLVECVPIILDRPEGAGGVLVRPRYE